MRPFPTVEQAYAHVRREAVRQAVMNKEGADDTPGVVLASNLDTSRHSHQAMEKSGMTAKACTSYTNKCSHCGNQRHTRDICFKLHGYPDQWTELQAKKKKGYCRDRWNKRKGCCC